MYINALFLQLQKCRILRTWSVNNAFTLIELEICVIDTLACRIQITYITYSHSYTIHIQRICIIMHISKCTTCQRSTYIYVLMYVKKRMSLTLSRCNQKSDPNPLFFYQWQPNFQKKCRVILLGGVFYILYTNYIYSSIMLLKMIQAPLILPTYVYM